MIDAGPSSILQIVEQAWNSVRGERQLRPAVRSGHITEQAKGVLSERFDITADAALALLRRLAEQSNGSLAEVSRRLVNGAQSPPRDQDAELMRQLIREATRC